MHVRFAHMSVYLGYVLQNVETVFRIPRFDIALALAGACVVVIARELRKPKRPKKPGKPWQRARF